MRELFIPLTPDPVINDRDWERNRWGGWSRRNPRVRGLVYPAPPLSEHDLQAAAAARRSWAQGVSGRRYEGWEDTAQIVLRLAASEEERVELARILGEAA